MLTIEVDRCEGCRACVEACPQGAISLVGGVARVDASRCTECGACVEACPTGAIRIPMPIAEREPVPARPGEAEVARREEGVPISTAQRGVVASIAATTLGFVGRYLLPRVAEVLVDALARRPSQGPGAGSSGRSGSSPARGAGRSGGRRRRHRGGR